MVFLQSGAAADLHRVVVVTVVAVVIKIGRNRSFPAFSMATSNSKPSARRRLTVSTSTIALLTTTPDNTITPISTTTEIGEPANIRPNTAPTSASGTENRMTKGCTTFSKVLAMMT